MDYDSLEHASDAELENLVVWLNKGSKNGRFQVTTVKNAFGFSSKKILDKNTFKTYTYRQAVKLLEQMGVEAATKNGTIKKYVNGKRVNHSDEEFDEEASEDDLNHYGVLGMKWGVRKDPQRAYERANQKLTDLDKRATKAGAKAARKETRSLRRQQRADTAWLFPKTKAKLADWAIGRSEKSRQKYAKKMSRAVSWYKEMENAFRDTKIENLNSDYTALGEKYSKIQVNDLMMNAQVSLANKQLRMIYRQIGK